VGAGGAEDALRFAGRTCADPAGSASRWKALTGGKAVGCLPPLVPEEIIHAAGILPVTVRGDEYGGSSGPWSVLDGWVFSPVHGLPQDPANFLDDTASGKPQFRILFTPRRMKVPSMEETLDQVEMLREWACDFSGRTVTDGALSKSIYSYNENRMLLSELEERLASCPGAFSAREVFRLIRSAAALPREAHSLLLRSALSRTPAPVNRGAARIFLGGATVPFSVMEAIDGACATLVGDDLEEGHRYNEQKADESGDPALAFSRRLRARLLGLEEAERRRAARLLDRVRATGADRLLYMKTGVSESAEYAETLAAESGRLGLPFLCLEADPAGGISNAMKEGIASFIRNGGQGG
jgi:benzoyl-CoA reductase subunit C